jgi:hypothetical protein
MNEDYFENRLNGSLSGSVEEITKQIGDTDVQLNSRESAWKNEKVKDYFKSTYGDNAVTEFNSTYDALEGEYNAVSYSKLNSKQMEHDENIVKNPYLDKNINSVVEYAIVDPDITGKVKLMTGTSDATRSFREASLASGIVYGEDGKPIDSKYTNEVRGQLLLIDEPVMSSLFSLLSPHTYYKELEDAQVTNSAGERIKALTYLNQESLKDSDGLIRQQVGVKANFYGEELGDQEVVSIWDTPKGTGSGFFLFKPQQEAGGFGGAISGPFRALYGTVSSLVRGVSNTALSVLDIKDNYIENSFKDRPELYNSIKDKLKDKKLRHYLEYADAKSKQSEVSISDESKESFFTAENVSTFVSDIAIQLLVARGAGKAATSLADAANASAKTLKTVSKLSTVVPLTFMATADARDSAIAAGFDKKQAAYFHFGMLAAMFTVNKAFSWVDKGIDANKLYKAHNDITKKLLETNAPLFKDAEGMISDAGVKAMTQTASKGFSKILESGIKGVNNFGRWTNKSGTWNDMAKESFEEVSETWSEHLMRGAANLAVGEDKFMSTSDPDYWDNLGTETIMSAIGGAAGAGMMKLGERIFASKATTPREREQMVDFILAGEDTKFNTMLLEKHKKGQLGATNMSLKKNPVTGAFMSMKEAGEGAISQNDAQLQLIQSQYNAIKSMVLFSGANNIREKIAEDLSFGDNQLSAQIVERTKELTKQYLDLTVNKGYNELLPTIKAAAENVTTAQIPELASKLANEFNTANKENTISVDTVKKLITISKEINETYNGKAQERFLIRNIGEKFESSKSENYGSTFLDKLTEMSLDDIQKNKDEIVGINEKVKENAQIVSSLPDDFEKLKELFSDTPSEGAITLHKNNRGQFLLNPASKKILAEKLNFIINNGKDANKITKQSKKYIINKQKELLEFIDNTGSLDQALEENGISKVNLKKFVTEYYSQLTADGNLSPSAITSLPMLKASALKDIINYEDLSNDTSISNTVATLTSNYDPNTHSFLIDQDGIDQEEFMVKLDELLNSFNPLLDKIVNNNYQEDLDQLEQSNQKTFFKGFGVTDNNEYYQQQDLHQQYKILSDLNSSMTVNGLSRFNKVAESKALLKQIQARQDQVQAASATMILLLDHKIRQLKINKLEDFDKAKELFADIKLDERVNLFENVEALGINADMLAVAIYAESKRRGTYEHKELIRKGRLVLRDLNYVNGELSRLKNDVKKLIDIAEKNGDIAGKLDQEKAAVAKAVKNQLDYLKDFLFSNTSDLQDSNPSAFDEIKARVELDDQDSTKSSKSSVEVTKNNKALIYAINDFLLKIPTDLKTKLFQSTAEKIFSINGESLIHTSFGNKNAESEYLNTNRNQFLSTVLPMYLNINDIDNRIQSVLEKHPDALTSEQEMTALSTIAHLTTNISQDWKKLVDSSPRMGFGEGFALKPQHLENMTLVWGLAGTGKTTFCAGYGASIAQQILKGEHKENSQILLSSADKSKLVSLKKTADQYGFILSSAQGKDNGIVFDDLLKLTKEDLKKTSIIILDEVTLAPYNVKDKLLLNQFLEKIAQFNLDRSSNPIRIVALGDSAQGGYYEMDEVLGIKNINISEHEAVVLGPTKLSLNFRSKITAITDFANKLKKRDQVKGFLHRLKSNYGVLENDALNRLGGVRIERNDFLNDKDFLEHLKATIEAYKTKDKPEIFKIGIATNDASLLENSELNKLITDKKYEDNFFLATHDKIQGTQFDYTIVMMDKESFAKTNKTQMEFANARVLATSVERSQYFTLIINDTEREHQSFGGHKYSVPDDYFDIALVKDLKQFRADILPNKELKVVRAESKSEVKKDVKTEEPKPAEPVIENTETIKQEEPTTETEPENVVVKQSISLEELEKEKTSLSEELYKFYSLSLESATTANEVDRLLTEIGLEEDLLNGHSFSLVELANSLYPNLPYQFEKTEEELEEQAKIVSDVKEVLTEEGQEELLDEDAEQLEVILEKEEFTEETKEVVEDLIKLKRNTNISVELIETEEFNESLLKNSQISAEGQTAEEFNKAFHLNGWLSAYIQTLKGLGVTSDNHFDYIQQVSEEYKSYDIEFFDNREEYERNQLEALNYYKKENTTAPNYNYSLHIKRDTSGDSTENKVEIIASTIGDNPKSVILCQVLVGNLLLDNDGKGKPENDPFKLYGLESVLKKADEIIATPLNGIEPIKPGVHSFKIPLDKKQLFRNGKLDNNHLSITPGKLDISTDGTTENFEFVKAHLKKLTPNIKFSKPFVLTRSLETVTNITDESGNNKQRRIGAGAGTPFVFYTYNDNIDLETSTALMDIMRNGLPMHTEYPFKNFKNGIGMLTLSNKPISFKDFLDLRNMVRDESELFGNNVSDIANKMRAQRDVMYLFAKIAEAQSENFSDINQFKTAKQFLNDTKTEINKNLDFINPILTNVRMKIDSILTDYKDNDEKFKELNKIINRIIASVEDDSMFEKGENGFIMKDQDTKLFGYVDGDFRIRLDYLYKALSLDDTNQDIFADFLDRLTERPIIKLALNGLKNQYENKLFAILPDDKLLVSSLESNVVEIKPPFIRVNATFLKDILDSHKKSLAKTTTTSITNVQPVQESSESLMRSEIEKAVERNDDRETIIGQIEQEFFGRQRANLISYMDSLLNEEEVQEQTEDLSTPLVDNTNQNFNTNQEFALSIQQLIDQVLTSGTSDIRQDIQNLIDSTFNVEENLLSLDIQEKYLPTLKVLKSINRDSSIEKVLDLKEQELTKALFEKTPLEEVTIYNLTPDVFSAEDLQQHSFPNVPGFIEALIQDPEMLQEYIKVMNNQLEESADLEEFIFNTIEDESQIDAINTYIQRRKFTCKS